MFTINNPTTNDLFPQGLPEQCRYAVWQKEIGQEGTPHLQGYITFRGPWRRARVERVLGGHAWIGIANGSEDACKAYCTKEETRTEGPWELGSQERQGQRNDLKPYELEAQRVKNGASLASVDPAVFVKYAGGFKALKAIQPTKMRTDFEVCVLIGDTGVGKTHLIYERFPEVFRPQYGNTGLWWDGYQEEDAILLDEYRGQCPLQKLLMILDKYPLRLETKGSSTPACYTKVFITTNGDLEDWYPVAASQHPQEFEALKRRTGRCDMSLYPETKAHWIDCRGQSREQLRAAFFTIYPMEPQVPCVASPEIIIDEPEIVAPAAVAADGSIPPIPWDPDCFICDEQVDYHLPTPPLYKPSMCDSIP